MKKCVIVASAILLSGWTVFAQEIPRVGTYLGYEYVRFNSATNIPAFSANGGGGQFILNFNKWLSGVADLGAVHNGNIGGYRLDSTVANFLFGPRLSIRHWHRVTPYLQVDWGGVYAASSTQITGTAISGANGYTPVIPGQPITARVRTSQTAFAMSAGGGIDINISKHVSFRPIALDYYLTRLQNLRSANDNNQNNIRYSTGVTFWFGGPKAAVLPAPPKTKTCPNGSTVGISDACPKMDLTVALNGGQSEVCAGDTVRLTAAADNGSRGPVSYAWTVNGTQASRQPSFAFDTTGKDPGSYRVGVNVNGDEFNPASAETQITVREYRAPSGTAQASPAQINAGQQSTVTASFDGQCGGPIQSPVFTASEGTMAGNQFDSSSVAFSSDNAEQRKTITITAKASDNRNTGTATTTIEVVKQAVIVPVRLPDILFTANSSRVNNCGKRILLEQLRSYLERDSGGTVVLVGHSSSDETTGGLAESRAMNSAAIITAASGICLSIPASQVQVSSPGVEQNGVSFEAGFCQSSVGAASTASAMRRVEVWFVPSGGKLPASVTNSQAATSLSLSGLGCPK